MSQKTNGRRWRGRHSGRRGFSSIPQIFELSIIITWFGVTIAGAKYLDSTITQRRAAETTAQDSIHASASQCASLPATSNLGTIGATASVSMANIDPMGLETAMLPPVPVLGVSYQQAFPSQQTPLRGTSAASVSTRLQAETLPNGAVAQSVKTVMATRQLNCQDIPQPTPTPDLNIKALSSTIWTRNVMGY